MASIFRPSFVKVNPQTGKKTKRKLRKWYVKYRDADGIIRRVPGYTDKEATRQLAAELERRAARQASGEIDRHAEHRQRPLAEHVADFGKHLEGKGDCSKHVQQTTARLQKLFDGCRFVRISDLSASRVSEWLAEQRKAGMSVKTSNYYLTAAKGFCRWLVRDRRNADNPLAHLTGLNPRLDIRRTRRALSADEFGRFIHATRQGEPFRGLSGPDRAMLYLTAAYTGLRESELASLTLDSLNFDGDPPTVTVEAGYSKRRRRDVQPLRADLAEEIQSWLQVTRTDALRMPFDEPADSNGRIGQCKPV